MNEYKLIFSIIEFCKFVTITVSFVHLKTEINNNNNNNKIMFLCVCVSVCVHCLKAWLVVLLLPKRRWGSWVFQLPFLGLAIFGLIEMF